MCGIVGFLNLDRKRKINNNNLDDLESAMEVIKHRGPDDSGVCGFSLDKAESFPCCRAKELKAVEHMDGVFGFNRLSIRDLSIEGHQPMLSEDKKVILVYNGEIYNDNELRNELKTRGGYLSRQAIQKLF